jgi:hypothetical protein
MNKSSHENAEKEGWRFGKSSALGTDIAYRNTGEGREVAVKHDGGNVHYDESEVRIISAHGGKIPLQVHLIKTVFDGIIINGDKHEKQNGV